MTTTRTPLPFKPGMLASQAGPPDRAGAGKPTRASSGRRLFHTLVAAAGWALFVYWWILVFSRVRPVEIRFTVFLLLASLVICVGLTAAWTIHNLMIFRRKRQRTQVREVRPDWSRDRLGRSIAMKGTMEQLQSDPVVQIRIEHEGKVYRPASVPAGAAGGAPLEEAPRTHVAS